MMSLTQDDGAWVAEQSKHFNADNKFAIYYMSGDPLEMEAYEVDALRTVSESIYAFRRT